MMRNTLRLLLSRSYTRSSWLSHSHFITKNTPWYRSITSNFSSSAPSDDKPVKEFKVTVEQFSGPDSSKRHIESEIKREVKRAMENDKWEDLERKMKELGVKFSSEALTVGLQDCAEEPDQAYAMFEHMKERPEIFEVDERVYNVIAGIIVQGEDERFWDLVSEMIRLKYAIQTETFNTAFGYFLDKQMITSAFDFYRYALHGLVEEFESEQCCLKLLDKIISCGEEMDVNLFKKVVVKFIDRGNRVSDIMVDSVLESLRKLID